MKQKIYKIKFFQVGEVYEIYAKNIYQSDFYAFLEIDGYIFDTKNNLVVDTSEEKLKAELVMKIREIKGKSKDCLLYTSPSPRDLP